jgi:hypothetical protein
MTDTADFAAWIKGNPPPDLQALVAKHGSYSSISAPAWAEHDAAVAAWQEARKLRIGTG